MSEVEHEETRAEVVEPQEVKLADAGEENAAETRTTAPASEEPATSVAETGVGEAPTATVEEGKDEEWESLQEQLAQLNRKLESLSRKVSKLSASSKASPSEAAEDEVEEVGALKVTSPPAQVAKEKKALLRRRARAAKKLPRPKRRKVGQS